MTPGLILLLALAIPAQAAPSPSEDAAAALAPETSWHKLFHQMVEDVAISPADAPQKKLALRKQPVFRWSQPVRGGDGGSVYLWLQDGRPEVIGTLFAWPTEDGERGVAIETHSFAAMPLTALWRGKTLWTPQTAGVEFQPVPDAPLPAQTALARATQMRNIAHEFSANSIDLKDSDWQLRLLAKPLYRYEIEKPAVVLDGALFAFVQGTDPEVLLLIEARGNGEKGYQWQYAVARFSDFRLQVRFKGAEVWKAQRGAYGEKNAPYFNLTIDKRKAPGAEAAAPEKDKGDVKKQSQ